jgi:hypothetical protein
MCKILPAVACLSILACNCTHAASLQLTLGHVSAQNYISSIYLVGEAQNGGFDTITLKATPDIGVHVQLINAGAPIADLQAPVILTGSVGAFLNLNSGLDAGVPRPAGQAFTYRNRQLEADLLDGGLGWILQDLVMTPSELSFTAGPTTGKITTATEAGGRLFLANIHFSLVPEPAAIVLLSTVMLGLAALCRHPARRTS